MTGPALHELAADYRRVLEAALTSPSVTETGELDDEFERALSACEGAIEAKVDGYGYVREALVSMAQRLVNEEKRLSERRAKLERKVERLEESLRQAFTTAKLKRVDGARWSVAVRAPPQVVEIYAPESVPRECYRQPPTPPIPPAVPDKAAIAKALKMGVEVPGCRLKDGKRAVSWE